MKKVENTGRSDKKRFFEHFKKYESDSVIKMILWFLWEYGIFVIPILPAYLLFYYVVFQGGGMEDGTSWIYLTLCLCIITFVVGGYFLRKLCRSHAFRKYSEYSVPYYKGNTWTCPYCRERNTLLAPCKKCGIYPELYKSDKEELKGFNKKLSRKEQKEFNDYKPQFEQE